MRAAAALFLLSFSTVLPAQTLDGRPAITPTLGTADLPIRVSNDNLAVLVHEITLPGSESPAQTEKIALDQSVTLLKIAKSGPTAILVVADERTGLCAWSGNGNCESWLFRRVGNHAVQLFDGEGAGISLLPTYHHGMRDLSTAVRMGHTTEIFFEVDEFNGRDYKPAYGHESQVGDDGKTHMSSRRTCNSR